jgi:hypothetical protein
MLTKVLTYPDGSVYIIVFDTSLKMITSTKVK